MNIKNKTLVMGLLASMVAFGSCDDYFDTDPDTIINEQDYIAQEDEMYKGFLGIFNRMQEAGDQAIFLTDTRAALLETTDNAPASLRAIYNYDETDGNEYADPTCYYSIIVACNDYINKMEDFESNVGGMTEIAEDNFPALVSSALRLKCWAYLMLGKIYGEAYWFDDPLTEKHDLSDAIFTHCNMKDLADRAINLLENGVTINGRHIPADQEVEWFKWLDPEYQDTTQYREWEYLTPPAVMLNAEFRSWRASYVDEAAAQTDWQWIHDNLLQYCYDYQTGSTELATPKITSTSQGYADIFQLNKKLQSDMPTAYFTIFFSEAEGLRTQVMSTIMYDYDRHQTNRLVQYLCPSYPDAESYYLRPSAYALHEGGDGLYNDGDIRSHTQGWVMNTLAGQQCVSKYYYGYDRTSRTYYYLENKDVYKIMPSIITFRAHDLHFLLAEAEVHLGNYAVAKGILNGGLSEMFTDKVLPEDWDQRYSPWVVASSGGYGNLGISGTANADQAHMYDLPVPTDDDFSTYSDDELKQMYDWALADEHMKEYLAEGKSYSYLCKIAERYANPAYRSGDQAKAREQVASRLAAKYDYAGESAIASKVRSSIASNGYFINWQLQ